MPDAIIESFGRLPDGREVQRLVLSAGPYSAAVLTLGATLQSLLAPDREGRAGEIVLGFGDPESQLAAGRFFGATIGRVANRIAGGRFALNGREYQLSTNEGPNTLHGGEWGFDSRLWDAEWASDHEGVTANFTLVSPDGDQGFPGALRATSAYRLTASGRLEFTFTATNLEAEGGRDTVVNLCNHAYFNLEGAGTATIDRHLLRIPAGRITAADEVRIPTGDFDDVTGTPLDFRTPQEIGPAIRQAHPFVSIPGGIDHNWVLDDDAPRLPGDPELRLAAVLSAPASGRTLSMWTDRPGIQAFTANQLNARAIGTGGVRYRQGDGLALETQLFPGAPSFEHFPSARLAAGATDVSRTVIELGTF